VDRSIIVALALVGILLGGCARRGEAGAPATPRPEPAKEQPASEPAPNAGAAPSSLDEDDGSKLTTIEAAEAEFARVEQQLDGLWAGAEKPDKKAESDPLAACDTSCKAFLSLERAAAAICRLAGEADARCMQARKSVERNRQRIAECACS
jgi:hypothetical protein